MLTKDKLSGLGDFAQSKTKRAQGVYAGTGSAGNGTTVSENRIHPHPRSNRGNGSLPTALHGIANKATQTTNRGFLVAILEVFEEGFEITAAHPAIGAAATDLRQVGGR